MSSISKPSILIAEDGRGKALRRVFGGVIIDAFSEVKNDSFTRIKRKLGMSCGYVGTCHVPEEVMEAIQYQKRSQLTQMKMVRSNINQNYEVMKDFMRKLP
ncbi:hypothetical protein BZG83_16460 [Salinivibrio sp. PR919]|nr:hypothetical protein BZG83_16460 [Salinivibrio sp. PR919]